MPVLKANPASFSAIQQALVKAPEFLASLGVTVADIAAIVGDRPHGISDEEFVMLVKDTRVKHIGQGHYAQVFALPDGRVLKVTRDEDDAQAAELVRRAGVKGRQPVGLLRVYAVHRLPQPDEMSERYANRRDRLYAIVVEPVSPLLTSINTYGLKSWLTWMSSAGVWRVDDSRLSRDRYKPETAPGVIDEPGVSEKLDEVMQGVKWLREHDFDVQDLHAGNLGVTSDGRGVLFDFGDYSNRRHRDVRLKMAKNPKIVGLGPSGAIEAAAGLVMNPPAKRVSEAEWFVSLTPKQLSWSDNLGWVDAMTDDGAVIERVHGGLQGTQEALLQVAEFYEQDADPFDTDLSSATRRVPRDAARRIRVALGLDPDEVAAGVRAKFLTSLKKNARRPVGEAHLPARLPEWAEPKKDELRKLSVALNSPAPKDALDCLSDAQIEKALFGLSSMSGTIEVDTDDIVWNRSSEGTYEEVLAEVEENGESYYDTSIPIIVDLMWNGDLELNDGHHRFVVNQEFEGSRPMTAEIQIPPGLARAWARKLLNTAPKQNPLPIDNDVDTGIGAVGTNQDADYFGLRVLMRPSTFHKLTLALPRDQAQSVDWMKEQIAAGQAFGSPLLTVDIPPEWDDADFSTPATVVGHEGRNRMYASKELYGDDDPVEVHIFPRGRRNRHMTAEWIERLNRGLVSERFRGYAQAPHRRRAQPTSADETRGPLFEKVLNAQSGRREGHRYPLERNAAHPIPHAEQVFNECFDNAEREFPDYYTRLTKMEARAKAGLAPNSSTLVIEGRERPISEMVGGKFYHGSPHELSVGTILEPGRAARNYKQSKSAGVSITSDVARAAQWGGLEGKARGYVYEVEPLGDVEVHRAGPANYGKNFVLWEGVVPRARIVAVVEDVIPNGRRSMPKVHAAFDECFDIVEEQFPDVGTIELHEDERAGADGGHGSERQFGYCKDGKNITIAFAAKTEKLPVANIRGLMAHEFGHALDYRYGDKLGKLLGQRLPEGVERRADSIAKAVFGRTIKYDGRDIQCVACQGKSVRPRRLGP